VRVEVRAFATLRVFLPPGSRGAAVVDVPEGSAIRDVARSFGIPDGTALVALLNGREAEPGQPLREGDVVTLFPPLAGG
jgi:molybdopterin converting factor small subunit